LERHGRRKFLSCFRPVSCPFSACGLVPRNATFPASSPSGEGDGRDSGAERFSIPPMQFVRLQERLCLCLTKGIPAQPCGQSARGLGKSPEGRIALGRKKTSPFGGNKKRHENVAFFIFPDSTRTRTAPRNRDRPVSPGSVLRPAAWPALLFWARSKSPGGRFRFLPKAGPCSPGR